MNELLEILNEDKEYFLYPYLFRLDKTDLVSVTYPGEYGMVTIVFPERSYLEDWILNESDLVICESCGKITNDYGVDDLEDEIPLCTDCFLDILDINHPEGYEVRDDGFVYVGDNDIATEYFYPASEMFEVPDWVSEMEGNYEE